MTVKAMISRSSWCPNQDKHSSESVARSTWLIGTTVEVVRQLGELGESFCVECGHVFGSTIAVEIRMPDGEVWPIVASVLEIDEGVVSHEGQA